MYSPQNIKNHEVDVAIRSSATCEDLSNCSFAGAHDTYLNVRSGKNVLEKIKLDEEISKLGVESGQVKKSDIMTADNNSDKPSQLNDDMLIN